MTDEQRVRRDVRKVATRARAKSNQWFFKTGPGEYGEGDRFLGVSLPALRILKRRYEGLPIRSVRRLLRSPWHEERLLALLILTHQYARGDAPARNIIYRLYLRSTSWINSWDLVDSSASQIVGAHLADRDRRVLSHLAQSRSLWERRIAVIATFHFIKRGEYKDALAIAGFLLHDRHDLIHKAVGWMLREIGKRNRAVEERFLKRHAGVMPRTMLRYAIERLPERRRRHYLTMKRT